MRPNSDLMSLNHSCLISLSCWESEFQEAQREIDALTRSKRDFLIDLENAYIDSRYGDVEYDRSHAEEILKSTEETINKLEVIARNVKLGKG